MATRRSLTYLMDTATSESPSWANKEIMLFHYHNPNGAATAFRKMADTIRDYVNQDLIPSGWHLAYGSLNSYYMDRLMATYNQDRIGMIELQVIIEGLERATENGYNKLGEHILGEQS